MAAHDRNRASATAGGWRAGAGSLRALAAANARFWPTVAPEVRRELTHWQAAAQEIGDPVLRGLALAKLRDELFNAEVAGTLATLAPRPVRARTVEAIVALELLFDYLDGRTEMPCEDPLAEGRRLFAPFIGAVGQEDPAAPAGRQDPDGPYLTALAHRTWARSRTLPSITAVVAVARGAAERCAQAQTRIHASGALGERQLEDWARAGAASAGLGWREYSAGCASSVLAMHALIAAAAHTGTSEADARSLDDAYLRIGAVITLLDSLVDHPSDSSEGEPGFMRLYESRAELGESLRDLTRLALERVACTAHPEHHAMTLAGVVAYYTTHPGARDPHARETVRMMRRELSPTIWPTLAVMGGWRAAKRTRALLRGTNVHERASNRHTPAGPGLE